MLNTPGTTTKILTGSASVLAATAVVFAQEKPYTQPSASTASPPTAAPAIPAAPAKDAPATTFVEAFTEGKVNLNVRLRYEHVNQDPTFSDDSDAFTLRTRLGFTTAPVYGFQGMLEFENIVAIPDDNSYNAAFSNGEPSRPVVADPQTTEVNQAWVSYTNWKTTLKGGRQRIVLDNARFVGDVGWRQNMQTFDAVTLTSAPVKDLTLFYGYVGRVNRVFGDVDDLPATNTDFKGDSHLFNVSYAACPFAKLTGYAYLLDLDNRTATDTLSCATYGLSLAGAYTFDKEKGGKISYRLEYAYQTDYADQPTDYEASYFNAEVSGDYDRYTLGGGYELLGSDGGKKGFATPLATLHAFNGWADVFLATPAVGLQDAYVFAGVKLPGKVPVRFVYHKYSADSGDADLGQEFDAVASHTFAKNWTVLAKYAAYDGKDAPAAFDKQVFWAQLEFNY